MKYSEEDLELLKMFLSPLFSKSALSHAQQVIDRLQHGRPMNGVCISIDRTYSIKFENSKHAFTIFRSAYKDVPRYAHTIGLPLRVFEWRMEIGE